MRDKVTSIIEAAGAVAVAVGAGLIFVPAGLIVGGCLAIAFAYRAAE